jgi:tetratricopeptide (TPR) repeat protein
MSDASCTTPAMAVKSRAKPSRKAIKAKTKAKMPKKSPAPKSLEVGRTASTPAKPIEKPAVEKPLFGLVMIVRNEAHGIAETLRSVKSIIDYWSILDTGSTDGTQDIICQELISVAGRIYEEPFIDFSASRNRILDLHGERTEFVIMLDSDDRVTNPTVLRDFLSLHVASQGLAHEAYQTNIRRGQLSYFLPLVMRTSARWRYSGRVHECSGRDGCPPASVQIPGIEIVQYGAAKSLEASKARWARDLVLLRVDYEADPKNARTVFYLGQTLDCLGQHEEALKMYQLRVELGGWAEEAFEAKLRCARMLRALGRPWPEVQQAFLDAHAMDSRRAEPLYEIADYYYYHAKDNLPLTFLFARRAMEMPRPDVTLFVDQDVYDWKAAHLAAISAFYLDASAKRIGKQAAERATAGRGDDLIRANRIFYAEPASAVFGAKTWRIPYTPQEPFVAANPSVHCDTRDQKWRCVVRTLNYRIVDGTSYIPPDNVIITRNVMVDLEGDPVAGFSIGKVTEMTDRAEFARTDYPVHGFEDCRLFRAGDKLYCTATVCDFSTERFGAREIAMCEIGDDYAIVNATPLRGPWSNYSQKNWMPLADSGMQTTIIYSTIPSSTIKVSILAESRQYVLETLYDQPLANPHLRGGSQLVRFDDGYLCLIHDVIFGYAHTRSYLHRFVWFDENFVAKKMSDLFFFDRLGIEYAAGLALDPTGKWLVASYSVNDSSANLAIFEAAVVRKALCEDFVV